MGCHVISLNYFTAMHYLLKIRALMTMSYIEMMKLYQVKM